MENKEKKENNKNNILVDTLSVLVSCLFMPYFIIMSLICDKSIKSYILDLTDNIYNLFEIETDNTADLPPTP